MVGALIAALRPILAVALIGGAATAIVAPAFDMAMQQQGSHARSGGAAPLRHDPTPTPDPDAHPNDEPEMDFETLVRMCLDKRDPDSDECAAAAEKSGLSYEEFRAKIVAKLEGDKPKTEPKHEEPKPEEPKAEPTKKVEPVVVKKTEPTKKPDDFGTAFEKCLAMRNFDSDECIRAEELSGLSTADFEAKFKAKLAAKDGSDFWTIFEKCLMTRDWRSDLCFRAQELIGFSDEDFHAKFDRYLAERDAKMPVVATPKPTSNPYAVFVACGMTHEWVSKACTEALTKSGLSQTEFRAKMTFTFGEFH